MDKKILLTQNGALGHRDTEYTIAHSIYASAIEKNGILDISALYLRASRSTTTQNSIASGAHLKPNRSVTQRP
jgi:hypothetical protein